MTNTTQFESPSPFAPERVRAAAVSCSDGRFGEQFDDLLQTRLQSGPTSQGRRRSPESASKKWKSESQ